MFHKTTTGFLIGLRMTADHPVTPLNEERVFTIVEAKVEDNKIYVRGAKSMWFEAKSITRVLA